MRITWKTIDKWRNERGIAIADLARLAGIPERTIYAGIQKDSRLHAATKSVMRSIFTEEFRIAERLA